MARLARDEIFDPSEIVAVQLIGKIVRSCCFMEVDERTGKNLDHRKRWLEKTLKHLAANFGIDLLAFSCISPHTLSTLRSRCRMQRNGFVRIEWTSRDVSSVRSRDWFARCQR